GVALLLRGWHAGTRPLAGGNGSREPPTASAGLVQRVQQSLDEQFHWRVDGLQRHLRILRPLVWGIDAGEVSQFTCPRLGVEAFDIPGLGDLQGGVDEYLEE